MRLVTRYWRASATLCGPYCNGRQACQHQFGRSSYIRTTLRTASEKSDCSSSGAPIDCHGDHDLVGFADARQGETVPEVMEFQPYW